MLFLFFLIACGVPLHSAAQAQEQDVKQQKEQAGKPGDEDGKDQVQNNVQVLFDQGNSELENGNFSEALHHYRQINTGKFQAGALYLNMGIAYVNIDSLGLAKYYFMKAGQFDSYSEQADEAISYVNKQFSRQSAVLPKLPWQQVFDWLNKNIGPSVVLFIGLTLLNIGILVFIFRWFVNFFPLFLKKAGRTTAIVGLLVIGLSFYLSYLDKRYVPGVMVHEETTVREEPNPESAAVSQAYEGYDFTVDKKKSEAEEKWVYVRMSNGQYGWIANDEIRIL